MSRKDVARRLLLEKAILDLMQEANKETRAEAKKEYEPGDADSPENLGRVRMDKGRETAYVADADAFEEWCKEVRPNEVESFTVTRVRSSFEKAMCDAVKKDGGLVDKETGEVQPVPGIKIKTGEPILNVSTGEGAAAAARELLVNGMGELE